MVKFTAFIYFSRLACSFFDSFFSKPKYTKSFLSISDISFDNLAIVSKDLIFCATRLLAQVLHVSIVLI